MFGYFHCLKSLGSHDTRSNDVSKEVLALFEIQIDEEALGYCPFCGRGVPAVATRLSL